MDFECWPVIENYIFLEIVNEISAEKIRFPIEIFSIQFIYILTNKVNKDREAIDLYFSIEKLNPINFYEFRFNLNQKDYSVRFIFNFLVYEVG